jgi:SAM-dependent methyltransferase
MTDTDGGWRASAEAWIKDQGEEGDYARRYVLDAPMIARLRDRGFRTALDVGCGEGRFCRIMRRYGVRAVGIDPTEALIACARKRDPEGDYRIGRAETLDVPPGAFDLVVSYLTLIDIPDLAAALDRMVAALRPGGSLLIANLNSFSTAGGWIADVEGQSRFCIDHYLEERAIWGEWRGIRVQNLHRPMSVYMTALLARGLELRHFEEPAPVGGDPAMGTRYRRAPWFHVMEWGKAGALSSVLVP